MTSLHSPRLALYMLLSVRVTITGVISGSIGLPSPKEAIGQQETSCIPIASVLDETRGVLLTEDKEELSCHGLCTMTTGSH